MKQPESYSERLISFTGTRADGATLVPLIGGGRAGMLGSTGRTFTQAVTQMASVPISRKAENMNYTLATIVNGIPTPLDGIPRNLSYLQAKAIAEENNKQWKSLIDGGMKPLVAYNMGAL